MSEWRKSTYCSTGNCVEWRTSSKCESGLCVEVAYRKASASAGNGACVEAAVCTCGDGNVLVRDSKDKTGPVLSFAAMSWRVFVAGIKAGEFAMEG